MTLKMSEVKSDEQINQPDHKIDHNTTKIKVSKATAIIAGGRRISRPKKRKHRSEKHSTECNCCH